MTRNERIKFAMGIFMTAFDEFIRREKRNIEIRVSERCLCGRLAIYLEKTKDANGLLGYSADVEYNRGKNGTVKVSFNRGDTRYSSEAKTIEINCDLILHSRGEMGDRDNLIAIEMKKTPGDQNSLHNDQLRLEALTLDPSRPDVDVYPYDDLEEEEHKNPEIVCGYDLGVMIIINSARKIVDLRFFADGTEDTLLRKAIRI